jgi:hypothetical protein
MYDSNVLLTSTSQLDQGTATNFDGYRSVMQGSAKYRPVYEADHEFAVEFDISDMYTVDKNWKYSSDLHNSDPIIYDLSAPYTYKGVIWGKGCKVDLIPAIESTFMSIEDNTNKEILRSYLASALTTMVMNENWFANYNLQLRRDSSLLTSSVGDDNQSAYQGKFTFGNLLFLSKDKTRMLTAEAAFTLNQADGINNTFNRYDLDVGYISNLPWNLTGNAKLSYFLLSYTQNANERLDNSYTGSLGVSRKMTEILSLGFLVNYNINNSNNEANNYKKWTALLNLSADYAF